MVQDGTLGNELVTMEKEGGYNHQPSTKPRLPPELLEQIVFEFALPCTYGDPIASTTLASCSLVNSTFRHWALKSRFSVIVAPRHVRDFRRWHSRCQNDMQGYNRALFIALDDVSKLTSMSAGWDVEMLKLLQQSGLHLQQLSLWTSETKALLRDPAQIRGARIRLSSKDEDDDSRSKIVEVMQSNGKRRRNVARLLRHMRKGKLIQGEALSAVPLKSDFNLLRNEAQTRAEMAAAKERARQTLPNWLKLELESKEAAKEIKKRYKAHISADAREYQHEREAAQEARKTLAENELKALETLSQHTQSLNVDEVDEDSEEEGDVEFDWACMPLKLSLCPSLPLHEHEEPLNFARMTIWTRVKELDVYVSVPSEVPRCLELFSSLIASPLIRFRFSSVYASLLISLTPSGERLKNEQLQQSEINIAYGLQRMLKSHVLQSLLFNEFNNHRVPDVSMLERAISSIISSSRCTDIMQGGASESQEHSRAINGLHSGKKDHQRSSLASSLAFDRTMNGNKGDDGGETFVSVRILQGNQAHFGKLKDRRQDFLSRALGSGPDCWSIHCV